MGSVCAACLTGIGNCLRDIGAFVKPHRAAQQQPEWAGQWEAWEQEEQVAELHSYTSSEWDEWDAEVLTLLAEGLADDVERWTKADWCALYGIPECEWRNRRVLLQ